MLPGVRVAGAHIRVSGGRYLAGLVVVDDREVIRAVSLPAPPDSDEGRQLEELYTIAHDLFAECEPEQLAVKVAEAQGRARAIGHRGEGAVLAAAGVNGIEVEMWVGRGLTKPAGLQRDATTQDAVAKLCSELTGEPTDESEIAQAAAAALASLKKLGG
jgi:hypothetical protein